MVGLIWIKLGFVLLGYALLKAKFKCLKAVLETESKALSLCLNNAKSTFAFYI